ncbi:hypothetical protein XENOCAPTIV_012127, partial [Xenoophorus captivus]
TAASSIICRVRSLHPVQQGAEMIRPKSFSFRTNVLFSLIICSILMPSGHFSELLQLLSLEHNVRRTFGAAAVTADTQPLCVALNVFVVEFDPERPAQVRLPHCVLQASPGVGKPVGHLRGTKQEVGTHSKQEHMLMFETTLLHIHSQTSCVLLSEKIYSLPITSLSEKNSKRSETEDRNRVSLQFETL